MQLLNKLTFKNIVGKPAPGQTVRFVGIARDVVVVQTQYGESVGFKGTFRAFFDGGEFSAPKCFLPGMANGMLAEQLAPDQETGEVSPVEFAFDVHTVTADNKVGYEFRIQPVMEQKHDPLAGLLAALPAPV